VNANSNPEGQQSSKTNGDCNNQRNVSEQPLNLRHYLLIASVGAAVAGVTLVGFPLLALEITADADCCFDDSLSDLMTFWGAVLAGFFVLFGMLISGLYIFTALRIDRGAKSEARNAARKVAKDEAKKWSQEEAKGFLDRYRKDELKKVDDAISDIESKANLSKKTMDKRVQHIEDISNASEKRMEQASASAEKASRNATTAAERINDQSTSSEDHMREAVERARRAANAANDDAVRAKSAAAEAEQFSRMASTAADEANVGKIVDEAKQSVQQAEQFAGMAKKSADEAERHARRASGGGPAPESA